MPEVVPVRPVRKNQGTWGTYACSYQETAALSSELREHKVAAMIAAAQGLSNVVTQIPLAVAVTVRTDFAYLRPIPVNP
jgi:hypothetical protein